MGNLSPDCISKKPNVNNEKSSGRDKQSPKKQFKMFGKRKKDIASKSVNISKRRNSSDASRLCTHVRSSLLLIRSKCNGYKFFNNSGTNKESAKVIFPIKRVGINDGAACTVKSEDCGIQFQEVDTTSYKFPNQKQAVLQQSQNTDNTVIEAAATYEDSSIFEQITGKAIIPELSDMSSDEFIKASCSSENVRKVYDPESFQSLNSSRSLGFEWDSQSVSKAVSMRSKEQCLVDYSEDRVGTSRMLKQFELLGELGRGAFGVVMKVVDRIDQQQYALKIIPLTRKTAEFAFSEPKVHAKLTPHPNLCRYMSVWNEVITEAIRNAILKNSSHSECFEASISMMHEVEEVLIIQMELFEMNLKTYLKDVRTAVDKVTSLRIFEGMLAGMAQLHSGTQIIMHRDLKPSNVFLKISTSGQIIKSSIGDFGLSTFIDDDFGKVGTPTYGAPEQKSGLKKYNEKVDVFSLGLILFELFHPPWTTEMERTQDLSDVKHGRMPDTIKAKFPRIARLVEKCVSATPSERPTVAELYENICDQMIEDLPLFDKVVGDEHRDKISLLREVRMLRRLLTDCHASVQ